MFCIMIRIFKIILQSELVLYLARLLSEIECFVEVFVE